MTDYWLSDLEWLAHLVGVVGMALIVVSMLYSLRKRRWLIGRGKMTTWLNWHHWAGLLGGVLALAHTLGNMTGLGLVLVALLLLVLGSSGVFFLERRSRRPLNEVNARMTTTRRERREMDARYRDLHARGLSGTPEGRQAYADLMTVHGRGVALEEEAACIREDCTGWSWWRHLHNVGTMMLVGVLLVHIWSKLFFGGGGMA